MSATRENYKSRVFQTTVTTAGLALCGAGVAEIAMRRTPAEQLTLLVLVPLAIIVGIDNATDPFQDERLRVANLPLEPQKLTAKNPIGGAEKDISVALFRKAGDIAGARASFPEITSKLPPMPITTAATRPTPQESISWAGL